jgi:hypothetical protein
VGSIMTSPAELLRELQGRGIRVRVDAPDLLLRGGVDQELALRIRQAKPELVRYLQGRTTSYPCDTCGRFAFQASTTCYWCRSTRTANA